jgi:hypothetical protein
MVFNATFNNISAIFYLVEETRVPGENHRPAARQTLSHKVRFSHCILNALLMPLKLDINLGTILLIAYIF